MHTRRLLAWLQAVVAAGALPAGWALAADPSGDVLRLPLEWLAGTPFRDYLIPGLVLLLVNGAGQATGCWLTVKRRPAYRAAAGALGGLLMLWIVLQLYWIGYQSLLQPLYLAIGALEIELARRTSKRLAA